MPKKRNQSYFSKPPTSAHPSISNRQDDSYRKEESRKSVNDLLHQLRVSQAAPVAPTEPRSDVNPQTVHPSLKHILQIPETPLPRPRAGMRPAIQGRRRPPGPPPPRSWLENSNQVPTRRASALEHRRNTQKRPNPASLGTLPNLHFPPRQSLQHQTLVSLAKNWEFHVHYDQHYLPLLPIHYKQLLLTYIAAYGPDGITAQGLQTLFLSESFLEGATGTEDLNHLDFSVSIGRAISLKDLKHFITTAFPASASTNSSTPDSWDLPASISPTPTCTLTHLSLAHPPPSISWRHLLQLSPHLSTLTHLSLAHWPSPTLTPNSTTAYRSTPTGNISYGDHDLYSTSLDNDFSGAANVLRQFSRDTYCLQWLDLSGCSSWMPALVWRKGGGIEWDGPWSGINTVVVAQDWIPSCLQEPCSKSKWPELLKLDRENARESGVSQKLRKWCHVECSLENMLQLIRGEEMIGNEVPAGRVEAWEGDRTPGGTGNGVDDDEKENLQVGVREGMGGLVD
ncbi:MAG: hypothetical protein Q9166_004242 [cf. Caloplaca sp. 2 TL-2023]